MTSQLNRQLDSASLKLARLRHILACCLRLRVELHNSVDGKGRCAEQSTAMTFAFSTQLRPQIGRVTKAAACLKFDKIHYSVIESSLLPSGQLGRSSMRKSARGNHSQRARSVAAMKRRRPQRFSNSRHSMLNSRATGECASSRIAIPPSRQQRVHLRCSPSTHLVRRSQ